MSKKGRVFMLRSVKCGIAAAVLTIIATAAAYAADCSGKWTWKQMGQGGNEVAMILELKQEGEKVTGTLVREGSERMTQVQNGSVKENTILFETVQMRGDQQFKSSYKGTLEGEAIKFVITSPGRDGQTRTREVTATKVK